MNELSRDVRHAIRAIAHKPAYAIAATLTLALGIGANTAIFSVVNAVLLRPLPYGDPDRIVMVWATDLPNDSPREAASAPDFRDWKAEARSFEGLAGFVNGPVNLTGAGTTPERVRGGYVSWNFFDLVSARPLAGRSFVNSDDRAGAEPVVILGYDLWQNRYGGSTEVIGETIRLDSVDTTVIGVMDRGFDLPGADLWSPLEPALLFGDVRGVHNVRILGKLARGVTVATAQAEMDVISKKLEAAYPEDNIGRGALVEPLREVVVSGVRPALLVLVGAVAFVLLIACGNVSSLAMTRATARLRELAIRRSLGATMVRIVRLLFVESVLLGVAGGLCGLGMAFGMIRAVVALQPGYLPRADTIEIGGPVVLFTVAISFLAVILFGAVPAIRAGRTGSEALLRGRVGSGVASERSVSIRRALVVGQFALAVVLVIGSLLLVRTFESLVSVDPGFDPRDVIAFDMTLPDAKYPAPDREVYPEWPEMTRFYDRALERVRAVPGVESAALGMNHPLASGFTSRVLIDGRPEPTGPIEETRIRPVTPEYFAVTRIPLREGRLLDDRDRHGFDEVLLVNEAFAAKFFPQGSPVGASVNFWGVSRRIVGVVGNVRFRGLDRPSEPAVYPPLAQVPMSSLSLVVRSPSPESLVRPIERAVWSVEPDIAFYNVETMVTKLANGVGARRFHMLLLGLFAGLALVLAAVGVYGVIAFQVLERTGEIGVRIALGATRQNVLRLFLSEGFRLTAAGILAGVLGALFLTKFLGSMLYDVSPTDSLTFVLVPVALAIVGIAATLVPAWRAARTEPLEALRYE